MRPCDAQRAQQVAHERGLAGAQVAVQRDERVADRGVRRASARRQRRTCRPRRPARLSGRQRAFLQSARGVRQRSDRRSSGCWRNCGTGRASSDSPKSAWPVSICRPPKPGLLAWLANGFHGEMDYMAAHGLQPRAARRTGARHVQRDHRTHGLPAAPHAEGWQAIEFERLQRPQRRHRFALRARPRLPQGAARAAAEAGRAHRAGDRARSATACSPTRRRCWKWSSPRAAARAGAASTRWC